MKRFVACAALTTAATLGATPAFAAWVTRSLSGNATVSAATLPAGSGTPTAAPSPALNSTTVRVSFDPASFKGSNLSTYPGGGYRISRFASITGGTAAGTTSCSASPCDVTAVPDGEWYFAVSPALQNWQGAPTTGRAKAVVDTVAPTAPMLTATPAVVSTGTANFAWTSETGATFVCKLDGGPAAPCTSPKPYTGLSVGSHTFTVQATDTAGNTGSGSIRSFTWTVSDFAGTDIAGLNAGTGQTQRGRLDGKDTLTFTFSKAVKQSTIDNGWTTSSTKMFDVRVFDGGLANDYLEVWNHTSNSKVAGFGTVDLGSTGYVTGGAGKYVVFGNGSQNNGSSTSINPAGTIVTIQLDGLDTAGGGTIPATSVTAATMVWTPGPGVTDSSGNPIVAGTVTESGSADQDF